MAGLLAFGSAPAVAVGQTPTVRVTPAIVTSGYGTTLLIDLGLRAPKRVSLTLASSHAALVFAASGTQRQSTVLEAGERTLAVPMTARSVASPTAVRVSVVTTSGTASTALSIEPLKVTAVEPAVPSAYGGAGVVPMRISLPAAAPAEGLTLRVITQGAGTSPGTITIAGGAKSAQVAVPTAAVTATTPLRVTAVLSATTDADADALLQASKPPAMGTVTVFPLPLITGLTAERARVTAGDSVRLRIAFAPVSVPPGVPLPESVPVRVFSIASDGNTIAPGGGRYVPGMTEMRTAHLAPQASATPVSVTAEVSGSRATTTVSIMPPSLRVVSITGSVSPLAAGDSSAVRITLDRAAPAGGISVPLMSSRPEVLTVPTTARIAPGATTGTVMARVSSILSGPSSAQVRAPALLAGGGDIRQLTDGTSNTVLVGEGVQSAPIPLVPMLITAVIVDRPAVIGGTDAIQLTVTLRGSATAPLAVRLVGVRATDGLPVEACTLPPTLTVAAGATVAVHRFVPPAPTTATVCRFSATLESGLAVSQLSPVTVTIFPVPRIIGVSLPIPSVQGGGMLSAAVSLDGPGSLPRGATSVTTTLSASLEPGGKVITPSFAAHQARVDLVVPAPPVTGETAARLVLTLNGVRTERPVTITAPPPRVTAVQLTRPSVIGGDSADITVELDHAPTGEPLPVAVSARSFTVTLPPTVTVPVGSTRTTVRIATRAVNATELVPITAVASLTGGAVFAAAGASATLRVEPLLVASATLDQPVVFGGLQRPVVTVRLNGRAPAGGAAVSLSSSLAGLATAAGAQMPTSVTIPAGSDQLAIPFVTPRVMTLTDAQVSAALVTTTSGTALVDGSSNTVAFGEARAVSVPLQLLPIPELVRVSTDSASIAGGGTVNVLVEMSPVVTPTLRTATMPTLRLVLTSAMADLVPRTTVQVQPGTPSVRIPLRVGTPASDTRVSLTVTMEVTRQSTPLVVRAPVPPSTPLPEPHL